MTSCGAPTRHWCLCGQGNDQKRRMLALGLTFEENCPDLRNTRVVDVVSDLRDFGVEVDVFDPWVDANKAQEEYGLSLLAEPEAGVYDSILLAVAHTTFRDMGAERLRRCGKDVSVLFDLKSAFELSQTDLRL